MPTYLPKEPIQGRIQTEKRVVSVLRRSTTAFWLVIVVYQTPLYRWQLRYARKQTEYAIFCKRDI